MEPDQIKCEIFTYKDGLLSSIAHDLKLAVHPYRIEFGEQPFSVRVWFDPKHIRVQCAQKNGLDAPDLLSPQDKRKIEQNIQKEVLQSKKYPDIYFEASNIELHTSSKNQKSATSAENNTDPGSSKINLGHFVGTLNLCGVSREVQAEIEENQGLGYFRIRIHQPDFNIRPYHAMLGALKIKPDVWVRIQFPLEDLFEQQPKA